MEIHPLVLQGNKLFDDYKLNQQLNSKPIQVLPQQKSQLIQQGESLLSNIQQYNNQKINKKNPAFNINKDQKNKVIATILGEGLGETMEGRQAILNTMLNRVGTPNLTGGTRNNIFDVISEPAQYSAFSVNNKIYSRVRDYLRGKKVKLSNTELKVLDEVKGALDKAEQSDLEDITGGVMYYYNPKKVNPEWSKNKKDVKQIGNHLFFNLQ